MPTFLRDLHYSLRLLRKSPTFTIIAVLTLALGIGATTSIFSVMNSVMLRPIGYTDPDRLMLIWGIDERNGNARGQVSATDIYDVKAQNGVFENVGVFANWSPTLSGVGENRRLAATQVGDGFFETLGAKPMLGRLFREEDQLEGNDFKVVLGHELWRTQFGRDPEIVGKTITLSTRSYEVIGVLPADLPTLPTTLAQGGELYRPVAEPYDESQRDARHLRAVARLKAGVSEQQAKAELATIAARLQTAHRESNFGYGLNVVSLYEDTVSGVRPALIALFVAVLLLLLIACSNVANLLLARSSARQRELAIRAAIGASRQRLIQQMLTESLLLATVAGALGIWSAHALSSGIAAWGSKVSSQISTVSMDLRVLGFACLATLLTGVLFGLAPALQNANANPNDLLRGGARGNTDPRTRVRNALIVAQVAVSFVLLVGAFLLSKSFQKLINVDPGYETEGRLVVNVPLPFLKYSTPEKQIAFYRELLPQVEGLPGVKAAGVSQNPPLLNFDGRGYEIDGRIYGAGEAPDAQGYFATHGWVDAMGIQLVQGRLFNAYDREDSQFVALVSESLVRQQFPDEDPIGKRLRFAGSAPGQTERPWYTIVGVVKDVRQHGLDITGGPAFFVPFWQKPVNSVALVVEAEGDPLALVAPIRNIVTSMEPQMAIFGAQRYDEAVSDSVATRSFSAALVSGFGVVALLLSLLGLYGVVSYTVTQRVQEIGIRMALGAQQADIFKDVLGRAMRLVLIGVAIGVIGALFATRAITTLLFGTEPGDPMAFVAIAAVLAFSATVASFMPAHRATQVQPVEALRYE